jgi:hypothetical protein
LANPENFAKTIQEFFNNINTEIRIKEDEED